MTTKHNEELETRCVEALESIAASMKNALGYDVSHSNLLEALTVALAGDTSHRMSGLGPSIASAIVEHGDKVAKSAHDVASALTHLANAVHAAGGR